MEAEELAVMLKLEMVSVAAGSVVAIPLIVAKDANIVVTAPLAIVIDVGFIFREEIGRQRSI